MSFTASRGPSNADEDNIPGTTRNAAVLGAATAFSRPPFHTRTSSNVSYLSADDAISAASARHARSISPISPIRDSRGPKDLEENRVQRLNTDAGTSLDSPGLPRRGLTKSPSHHAASVAAARAPASSMIGQPRKENVRSAAKAFRRPAAPPKPRRLSQHFGSTTQTGTSDDQLTDATSIPPTTSLVDLFESKSNKARQPTIRRPPPEPVVIAASPDLPLKSPQPVRSSGGITTMFQMELDGARDDTFAGNISASSKSPVVKHEPTQWDPNTRTFRPQSEVKRFEQEMSAAESKDRQNAEHAKSLSISHDATQRMSPFKIQDRDFAPSPSRGPLPPTPSNETIPSGPIISSKTNPMKIQRPIDQMKTDDQGNFSPSSLQSNASLAAQYHQLHPRRTTPAMTGDQLANAMVASSLASSRANSPRPHGRLEPPPPPTRRHKHTLSFSRTPSPVKTGMLQTLRKVETSSSSSDEDPHPYSKHKRDKHRIVRKHPNKHHEGDRKRWREAVTERERRRYEGVWAANKGIYYSLTVEEQRIIQAAPTQSKAQELQAPLLDQVSNLVAREIWSRSRLPPDTLEVVWDLVDSDSMGRLSKAEFVVGLWLIDQNLKGRKLPVKVSESVWASVRGLQGIKIRKSIK